MPDLEDLDTEDEAFPDAGEDNQFKEMRRAANKAAKLSKENAALAARLADMERKVAFTEAGLTLSDKQRTALLAAHGDTEMTREALRATAAELKFIEPDEADEAAAEREAALAGQAGIAAAHQGARPPAPVAPLPERIAQAEASGDWDLAGALKSQQVAALMRQGQTVQLS